jgi:hypothetical protein
LELNSLQNILLTIVVVLKDVPNALDGHGVGVLEPLAVVVVERLWLRGIPVALGKVDSDDKVEAEATANVVKEGSVLQEGTF